VEEKVFENISLFKQENASGKRECAAHEQLSPLRLLV
jgi:hypothetical protein